MNDVYKQRLLGKFIYGNDPKKATGRTTRIIDIAVKEFLKNGKVRFKDHVDYTGMTERQMKNMAKNMLYLFKKKLYEHSGEKIVSCIYSDGTIDVKRYIEDTRMLKKND